MFDRGKLKIFVRGIKNNEHGILWTKGGVILIDDETVTLKYLGTLAVFDRKTVNYYRETDGTVIFGKVLRIYDDKQDFLVAMFPTAFDKFMKIMKDNK